jgi:hypothetical protein
MDLSYHTRAHTDCKVDSYNWVPDRVYIYFFPTGRDALQKGHCAKRRTDRVFTTVYQ